tara:strand:+ start:197 stop:403 length:207 start_codon:yes stop_codon:yes gene_type:complete
MSLKDFYEWSSDNLSKLNGLDNTSEEAKQIKIKMGYSSDADFWDINHDVVKIRDVLDWLEEWKEKEKA